MNRKRIRFLCLSMVALFLTAPRLIFACQFLNHQSADPVNSVPYTGCALYINGILNHYDTYSATAFFAKTDNVVQSVQIAPYGNPAQKFNCPFSRQDAAGNLYWACECPASGAILYATCSGAAATLGASQPWLACGNACGL